MFSSQFSLLKKGERNLHLCGRLIEDFVFYFFFLLPSSSSFFLMARLRVTETANELTNELDAVGPKGIVRLLRQTDQQLFAGWGAHQSVYDMVCTRTCTIQFKGVVSARAITEVLSPGCSAA
jgi:hypothetical protein